MHRSVADGSEGSEDEEKLITMQDLVDLQGLTLADAYMSTPACTHKTTLGAHMNCLEKSIFPEPRHNCSSIHITYAVAHPSTALLFMPTDLCTLPPLPPSVLLHDACPPTSSRGPFPRHIAKCLGVTQLPAGFVPKQPETALAMLLELCEVSEEGEAA